jgi:cysteinyl-tRNA synthetase
MDDDFNTPIAVSELQSLAREVNTAKAAGDLARAAVLASEMRALGARLGLLGLDAEVFLRKQAAKKAAVVLVAEPGKLHLAGGEASMTTSEASRADSFDDAAIEQLIAERTAARKAKDFKESDRIRDLLAAGGIVLEDMPGGKTLWRRG